MARVCGDERDGTCWVRGADRYRLTARRASWIIARFAITSIPRGLGKIGQFKAPLERDQRVCLRQQYHR